MSTQQNISLTSLNVALKRRDEGMEAVTAADVAVHRGAGVFIRAVIQEYADSGLEFTAEDVREALKDNDVVVRELASKPNLLPAHVGGASKEGLIVSVGMCMSTRVSRHANRILVWKGTRRP